MGVGAGVGIDAVLTTGAGLAGTVGVGATGTGAGATGVGVTGLGAGVTGAGGSGVGVTGVGITGGVGVTGVGVTGGAGGSGVGVTGVGVTGAGGSGVGVTGVGVTGAGGSGVGVTGAGGAGSTATGGAGTTGSGITGVTGVGVTGAGTTGTGAGAGTRLHGAGFFGVVRFTASARFFAALASVRVEHLVCSVAVGVALACPARQKNNKQAAAMTKTTAHICSLWRWLSLVVTPAPTATFSCPRRESVRSRRFLGAGSYTITDQSATVREHFDRSGRRITQKRTTPSNGRILGLSARVTKST